jgi:beta-lactamase regulating signal transducer with metallopeptidase domain
MTLLAIQLPEMIGITILHSLWQITLLWIVLITVLKLWPKASSTIRYGIAIATLILCVVAIAATAIYQSRLHEVQEEVSALSISNGENMRTANITVKQTVLSRIMDALDACTPIVAWGWCAGLVVMGLRFGGSFFYLKTLRAKRNIEAVSDGCMQELERLSKALGMKCQVAIASSRRISTPLALGSFSPIILLPAGLLAGLSTAQIEAILVHELYHIKRRDYIINICQAIVEAILFYHPAIWHINNIIREERENCCDDQTLRFCGDPITYARVLTQIQEINTSTKPTLAMSATGPNSGNFSKRIKRLFNIYPDHARNRSKGIFAIGFLAVYLCIVFGGANLSTAQPAEVKKKSVETKVTDPLPASEILIDSIHVTSPLYTRDLKKTVSQQASSIEDRAISFDPADSSAGERRLDKCLKQVSQILQMASFRRPGQGLVFATIDSLHVIRSQDLFKKNLKLLNPFYVNLSNITTMDLDDTIASETIEEIALDKNHPFTVDSITVYNIDENDTKMSDVLKGEGVQVFPNSTNGSLTISFTPPRDHSRVTIVLVDSHGNVAAEITNSIYNNIPIALPVDVGGYKKGIYILHVIIDGAKSHQRVVIE